MRSLIFTALVLTQIGALAIDERILQPGSNGTATVLLTVAYVEQSAVFSDDNGLLRRIAYVETRDGAKEHDNIWAISEEALQRTQISGIPTLNVKHNLIALEFDVQWKQMAWEDLRRPLYSALAARLLLFLAPERLPDSGDIEDQARFWKQYYNTNGSISDFTGAAYELEVLETCEVNICENGGTCSKHTGNYTCTCPPGFSGFLCEEEDEELEPTSDLKEVGIGVGATIAIVAILFVIVAVWCGSHKNKERYVIARVH